MADFQTRRAGPQFLGRDVPIPTRRPDTAPLTSVRPQERPQRYGNAALAEQTGAGQQAGAQAAGDAEVFIDEFVVEAAVTAVLAVVPQRMQANAVPHLTAILQRCAWDRIQNVDQVAYILATTEHESGFGTPRLSWGEPLIEEPNQYTQRRNGTWTSRNHLTGRRVTGDTRQELDEHYWDDSYGGRLGNERGTPDASNYKGRGYVQLTGRDNYQEMSDKLNEEGFTYFLDGVTWGRPETPIDLIAHPDHVNRSRELAAKVLGSGSMDGDFTGRALPDYIDEDGTDFRNARRVINGDVAENGEAIAARARAYSRVLGGIWPRVFWRQGDAPR